jgi:hypothetical protein
MHDEHSHGDPNESEAASPDPNAVIEQVRELLFGEHRRASEAGMKSLEDRLAALTATLEARFGDLERRIEELKAETDHARGHHAEALGASLMELGERIRALATKPDVKPGG